MCVCDGSFKCSCHLSHLNGFVTWMRLPQNLPQGALQERPEEMKRQSPDPYFEQELNFMCHPFDTRRSWLFHLLVNMWLFLNCTSCFPGYHPWPAKETHFWNLAAAQGIFCIQSCIFGFGARLLHPVFQADKVRQERSWFNCLIASGFFFFLDKCTVGEVHVSNVVFKMFDLFFVVHHFLAFGGLFGLATDVESGHYIFLMGRLLEMMSTPFTPASPGCFSR